MIKQSNNLKATKNWNDEKLHSNPIFNDDSLHPNGLLVTKSEHIK